MIISFITPKYLILFLINLLYIKYKIQPAEKIITVDMGSKTNKKIIIPIIIEDSESKAKKALVACFKLSVS